MKRCPCFWLAVLNRKPMVFCVDSHHNTDNIAADCFDAISAKCFRWIKLYFLSYFNHIYQPSTGIPRPHRCTPTTAHSSRKDVRIPLSFPPVGNNAWAPDSTPGQTAAQRQSCRSTTTWLALLYCLRPSQRIADLSAFAIIHTVIGCAVFLHPQHSRLAHIQPSKILLIRSSMDLPNL